MQINSNTKIAAILKHNPEALEAIISLNPKFSKLRNPVMRKLMAGRTSIGMAAKIVGCDVADFFEKLKPLGFEAAHAAETDTVDKKQLPPFIENLKPENIRVLDVRPVLDEGKDPLSLIMKSIKDLPAGDALKIINTFEPTPLIKLLEKKGYTYYVDTVSDNEIETYFFKTDGANETGITEPEKNSSDWQETKERFTEKLKCVDVRQLEMPLPMHTILENLNHLEKDEALYVYHKRIPVFLLPELRERGFDYRISEISDGEVHLLIFYE